MGKIINLFDYKKNTEQKETLTKEEFLYDDDRYLDMFFHEEKELSKD
ncbi:hypothetical protein [Clostridium sporogenes]